MSAECLPVVGLTCRLLSGRLLIGCGGASGDVVWGPAPRVSSCQLPAVKIRDKTSALFFFLSKSSLSESAASLSINFVQFLTSLVQFFEDELWAPCLYRSGRHSHKSTTCRLFSRSNDHRWCTNSGRKLLAPANFRENEKCPDIFSKRCAINDRLFLEIFEWKLTCVPLLDQVDASRLWAWNREPSPMRTSRPAARSMAPASDPIMLGKCRLLLIWLR